MIDTLLRQIGIRPGYQVSLMGFSGGCFKRFRSLKKAQACFDSWKSCKDYRTVLEDLRDRHEICSQDNCTESPVIIVNEDGSHRYKLHGREFHAQDEELIWKAHLAKTP